jgi:hypothetical protein
LVKVRSLSMKSCASGLSERFFKVMIATGIRVLGNSVQQELRGRVLMNRACWVPLTQVHLSLDSI